MNHGTELKDYKIFNFNGKSKLIQVDYNRFINHKRRFYTSNWDKLDMILTYPDDKSIVIDRPKNLDKLIELAEKLATNIPFLRTDFYVINDKIYFGELTFYPEAGLAKFYNYKDDKVLGEWLELPKEKRENNEK